LELFWVKLLVELDLLIVNPRVLVLDCVQSSEDFLVQIRGDQLGIVVLGLVCGGFVRLFLWRSLAVSLFQAILNSAFMELFLGLGSLTPSLSLPSDSLSDSSFVRLAGRSAMLSRVLW
jgi:hypothetical protein